MGNIKTSEFMNLVEWGEAFYWNDGQGKDLNSYPIKPQIGDEGNSIWLPVKDEKTGEWHLGFEWSEPRDIQGVLFTCLNEACQCRPLDFKVEYWNKNWPIPNPERLQGARRGWIGIDDPFHGEWIRARGETRINNAVHSFTFDPLDLAEIHRPQDLEWAEDFNVCYRRTLKLRLVFRGDVQPVITSLKILSTACLQEKVIEVRFGCGSQSTEDWSGSIAVWNGGISDISSIGFEDEDRILSGNQWKCATKGIPKGLRLGCMVSEGSRAQGDQTLVTLKTKTRTFTFRSSDLQEGPIWIKDYSVLVSRPILNGDWIGEIEKALTGRKPIYERIYDEPDHSYCRASREIPPLDVTKQAPYGRYTILGWEGVRQEFALRYNGDIFADKRILKLLGRDATKIRWAGNTIHFRFGTGDPPDFRLRKDGSRQRMLEPQLPVYLTQWEDRELEFTQTAFGALINGPVQGPDDIKGDEELVAMVRLKIRNTTEGAKKAILWLDITPAEELILKGGSVLAKGRVIPSETVKDGWKVQAYDRPRFRCHVKTGGKGVLKAQPLSEGGVISSAAQMDKGHRFHFGSKLEETPSTTSVPNAVLYQVDIPGFSSREIDVFIPFATYFEKNEIELIEKLSFDDKFEEVKNYWNSFYNMAAKIQLPENILEDFFKAVPWHILVTADRDPVSLNYVIPAGTYAYGACGNEACMQIRLLDMLGYHHNAEKYLNTFINSQGARIPDGNFKTGDGAFVAVDFDAGEMKMGGFSYNLDHGFIMSCFADHYALSGDKEWLKRVSQNLVDACDFILRERKATMLTDEQGNRLPQYGLMPAGHLEDNPEWRHWFAVNAQACGGMLRIVQVLKDIEHPEAPRLIKETEEFRNDIRTAVQRAMEESPVIRIADGTYIPHIPTRTGIRGREWGWIREAAYGPLHLVDGLVLDPDDERVTWILKDLEDNLFVNRQYGRPVDIEKYWFSRGGVTIQANLLNNGLAYLKRDQVSHALRALYNNIGQHLYPDVLAFTEHPVIELGHGVGPFFKTPDEAQFLVWLRNYLIREDSNSLWICQGAPRHWYEAGKVVKLNNVPSAFGPVSCTVESQIGESLILASITVPNRKVPEGIYLRVRHPAEKQIKAVYVNGQNYTNYDKDKECIVLRGLQGALDIKVIY